MTNGSANADQGKGGSSASGVIMERTDEDEGCEPSFRYLSKVMCRSTLILAYHIMHNRHNKMFHSLIKII